MERGGSEGSCKVVPPPLTEGLHAAISTNEKQMNKKDTETEIVVFVYKLYVDRN